MFCLLTFSGLKGVLGRIYTPPPGPLAKAEVLLTRRHHLQEVSHECTLIVAYVMKYSSWLYVELDALALAHIGHSDKSRFSLYLRRLEWAK